MQHKNNMTEALVRAIRKGYGLRPTRSCHLQDKDSFEGILLEGRKPWRTMEKERVGGNHERFSVRWGQ